MPLFILTALYLDWGFYMLQLITGILSSVFGFISGILPLSPFRQIFVVSEGMNIGLGWLNWLVPLDAMGDILFSWVMLAVVVTAVRVVARITGGVAGKVIDTGTSLVPTGVTDIVSGG